MKSYTPRQLRQAVWLAVVVTAVAVVLLLDPTCHRGGERRDAVPARAISP